MISGEFVPLTALWEATFLEEEATKEEETDLKALRRANMVEARLTLIKANRDDSQAPRTFLGGVFIGYFPKVFKTLLSSTQGLIR
jgi:hypothetical protein